MYSAFFVFLFTEYLLTSYCRQLMNDSSKLSLWLPLSCMDPHVGTLNDNNFYFFFIDDILPAYFPIFLPLVRTVWRSWRISWCWGRPNDPWRLWGKTSNVTRTCSPTSSRRIPRCQRPTACGPQKSVKMEDLSLKWLTKLGNMMTNGILGFGVAYLLDQTTWIIMDPKSLCFRETSHKWHFAAVTNVVFDLWWPLFRCANFGHFWDLKNWNWEPLLDNSSFINETSMFFIDI